MISETLAPGIEIYQGDCIEIMKGMNREIVDLVFTSPPYNVGLSYKSYDDNDNWDVFLEWIDGVYKQIANVTADNGRIYSVLSDRLLFDLKPIQENHGLIFGQLLTWCKPNFGGGAGRITGDWNYLTEQILLFRKGKRTKMINGECNTHSYFVIPTPQSNYKEGRYHPAQFPIRLPNNIISRTPGNVVFDPFMGSGTVGIAAIKNSRGFIGIEIDPDYYAIAKRRIQEALMQPRLL
jgi:site-specific DNA-methyltransferase (adenine-specific)